MQERLEIKALWEALDLIETLLNQASTKEELTDLERCLFYEIECKSAAVMKNNFADCGE